MNRAMWGSWDWSDKGEEWSNSELPGWKDSVVENVLVPFIGDGHTVLEIGPGGGRWTEYLGERASRLTLVDVTPECIELCKKRFAGHGHIDFHVNDGNNLEFVPSSTIERVWSFDVFVHILSPDVERYVAEIARVLTPGGMALIHHAKKGYNSQAWRSDMTADMMFDFATNHGLEVTRQFESWGDGNQRFWPTLPVSENHDVVSVLRKPL
ncbi:class I SAM-dependent methyltransferase [Mycolicibacterium litorale]|uniref:class I SAM-dependent methyltransferase n=1 Tax=Mycolicibacterium litorale TaxID=758802 RepID=UPI00399F9557